MNLIVSSSVKRALKATVKKHPKLQERIAEKLNLLSSEPFNPILRTHKLKGDLAGSWSCTIEYDCRVLFDFVKNEETGEEEILLIDIGTHDEVY
ncbi:MAG: type II toxin-antitoxin system YafQ family toxin [Spirulina sp.]